MPSRAGERGQALPLIVIFLSALTSIIGSTLCARFEHDYLGYGRPTIVDTASDVLQYDRSFLAANLHQTTRH